MALNTQLPSQYADYAAREQSASIANDRTVSANLLHGLESRMQRERISLADREMRLRESFAPLERAQMEQRMQGAALDIRKSQLDYDNQLMMKNGMVELGQIFNQIGKLERGWADPQAESMVGDWIVKHPYAPPDFIDKIQGWVERAKDTEIRARLDRTPADAREVIFQVDNEIAAGRIPPEQRTARIAELMAIKNNPKGRTITGYDAQGNPIFSITEGGSDPTPATMNRVQQNLNSQQKSFELLNELETSLRPEDLGVAGVLGETVVDRIVTQFNKDAIDLKRADNRTKLKTAIQGMIRQISSDTGRFSESDRARAEAALPSSGMLESYPRAIQAIQTLKEIIAKRAVVDAQTGNIEIPRWALTPDQIYQMYKANVLTRDQASQLIEKYHPKWTPPQ